MTRRGTRQIKARWEYLTDGRWHRLTDSDAPEGAVRAMNSARMWASRHGLRFEWRMLDRATQLVEYRGLGPRARAARDTGDQFSHRRQWSRHPRS